MSHHISKSKFTFKLLIKLQVLSINNFLAFFLLFFHFIPRRSMWIRTHSPAIYMYIHSGTMRSDKWSDAARTRWRWRRERSRRNHRWPQRSIWNTGRISSQAFTQNKLIPSLRWAGTNRKQKNNCNGWRKKKLNSWRKLTNFTLKEFNVRNSTWRQWVCQSKT